MTTQHNLIKEIARLYAGLSFYYSDFLSLEQTQYNSNSGYSKNYYNRIRVIEKNNLGEFFTSTKINDIKSSLNYALLNSRVASVLPSEKKRVYYPYIHTLSKITKNLNYRNIQKINYRINSFKRKYKPDFFDFTIKKNSKIIVSSIGSLIEQDFLTVKFNIRIKDRKYFEHYKINDFSDIKFPEINGKKFKLLAGNYNLILSPRATAKIALFLFDNNLDLKSLELNINPYLYKGVQANLYDDEGTFRIKSKYNGLSGGNIFQNDNSSGYFYDFNKHKFVLRQPDLEIKGGNFNIKDLTDDYLLVNDFDSINISYGKIVINADLSLFGKGKKNTPQSRSISASYPSGEGNYKNRGYMIKTIKFPLGELKNTKKFTNLTKVTGMEDSSVKAPYIYLGKNYE